MPTYSQEEWNALMAAYPPGTAVSGEVVRREVFGVFVRLDALPEVVALLEIIHFRLRVDEPGHRIEYPEDDPAVGERIDALILGWCLVPKDVRLTQLQHLEWIHSRCLAKNNG
jgi:ribosomal protein S1